MCVRLSRSIYQTQLHSTVSRLSNGINITGQKYCFGPKSENSLCIFSGNGDKKKYRIKILKKFKNIIKKKRNNSRREGRKEEGGRRKGSWIYFSALEELSLATSASELELVPCSLLYILIGTI